MSAHLLLITLGPVQELIAQARRTRDLWYGSHLLSELTRAGAKALAEAGAHLILPALEKGDPELEPCEGFLRASGKPPAPLANKLLAELPAGLDPEETVRAARAAVIAHWKRLADDVRARCRPLLADNIDPVWDEQIETALEFYASWAPLAGDYAEVRRKLERTIAGRKLLRDFVQWRNDRAGAPKSSFDGARVSVLAEVRANALVRRYRIGRGEQLDAVGLVKRAGGEPEQFPPIVNIALAPWIQAAAEHAQEELAKLRERARELDLPRVMRPDLAWTKSFPFDGEALVASRVPSLFEELAVAGDPDDFVRHELRPLYRILGEPPAYVACLVADGDRMGQALDALADPEAHRAFSQKLACFAAVVRCIVEQQHCGSLVYAGGDDVLAFLPVADAVSCADWLRRLFAAVMGGVATLSVGIGIGHVMEGMAALLELGRAAERLAKTQRNALALILDKRSGGRRQWVCMWQTHQQRSPDCISSKELGPASRLKKDAALVADTLSTKKIHEIGAILRRLPEPAAVQGAEAEAFRLVLEGEVRRALARNEPKPLSPAAVELSLPEPYAAAHEAVARWVDRMLIARAIAEAEPRPRMRAKEAA